MNLLKSPGQVVLILLLTFAFLSCFNEAKAQTTEQLNSQVQWMNTWAGWMSAVGHSNVQVKMIEARAKLIAAQAEMVSALANANKVNAEALQELERARSLALDNSLKKAETFYGKKALYENYRSLSKTRPKPSEDDLYRYSRCSAPERLTPSQLNSLRGEIYWPSLLQKEEFSEYRDQLEDLFAKRLARNQDIYQEAKKLTDEMNEELRSMVRKTPSAEYIKAKKFIKSLAYESSFSVQAEGLARAD